MSDYIRAGPVSRFGDLLPLPACQQEPVERCDLGRRAKQKLDRAFRLADRACGTIRSLNELAGFADSSVWPRAPLNIAQDQAIARIQRLHASALPPVQRLSDEAALREMPKTRSGYFAVGELVSYKR